MTKITQKKENTFLNDFLAGLTTSFAAIALGAAFGIQSGRGAFAGMIAAAVIPIITSIFGGTRLQASGPTAPMTAVTALVVASAYEQFEKGSGNAEQFITLVFILNALFLIIAGLTKLGKFISFVPQVVVIGFMNGIAVLIWWDQIKKLFGVGGVDAIAGPVWQNLIFASVCFATILLFPWVLKTVKIPEKIRPFIPGTLVVIVSLTYIFLFSPLELETVKLGTSVNSIASFWDLIKSLVPTTEILKMDIILKALPFALQLTLLAYLDSLLTSLVIDKITNEKSQKNKELIAQGLGNAVTAIVGGIPGAQATIRSVILLKEGAKTRLAGVLVGLFTLLGLFVFQNLITLVASSIFIGVLVKAGLDVFEKDYLKDFIVKKWYQDKTYLWQFGFVLYTTVLTVLIDLNVAVISGTILFYLAKKFLQIKDIEEIEESSIGNEA
jgi:SulP family sulfate permease